MESAVAWAIIGGRMRQLREDSGLSLRRVSVLSGWCASHLSRAERGCAKPGEALVAWYDQAFGAGDTLVDEFAELEAAVRRARARARSRPYPVAAGTDPATRPNVPPIPSASRTSVTNRDDVPMHRYQPR